MPAALQVYNPLGRWKESIYIVIKRDVLMFLKEERERDHWVQCETCQKWHMICFPWAEEKFECADMGILCEKGPSKKAAQQRSVSNIIETCRLHRRDETTVYTNILDALRSESTPATTRMNIREGNVNRVVRLFCLNGHS